MLLRKRTILAIAFAGAFDWRIGYGWSGMTMSPCRASASI